MNDAALAEPLITHTLARCRAAHVAGLPVTQARAIDVFRSLAVIDWRDTNDLRIALRTNLVASREDEMLFDRVFAIHFGQREAEYDGEHLLARSELLRGELDAGRANAGHRDMLTEADTFGAEEVARRANLAARWDPDAPPLATVIRELARATRKTRKTRLVMLCDVSGSMDTFNPFLLQLMFGLQQALKASRTLVFSTQLSEITNCLRRRSIVETLVEIGDKVRHWSGGTDLGAALAELNRGVLREGSARSTVLIVINDGYDNGAPERIARELEATKRRIRTLVWINPMFGASTFTVRAAGMRAALPYVDHFLPAFNAKALHVLEKGLADLR